MNQSELIFMQTIACYLKAKIDNGQKSASNGLYNVRFKPTPSDLSAK